eukprot:99380-Chlamydomonas_euryale.AAC.1
MVAARSGALLVFFESFGSVEGVKDQWQWTLLQPDQVWAWGSGTGWGRGGLVLAERRWRQPRVWHGGGGGSL